MKINFKTAVLTDINGNVTKNAAGEPTMPDYKILADRLHNASADQVQLSNLDKMDLALQLNRTGEIDIELSIANSIRQFLNIIPGVTGSAAIAWMNVIDEAIASEEKTPKEK